MSYAFPSLTAEEACTYNTGSPNTITLSDTALTNYFTVAAAVTAGDGGAVDGMTVIASARKSDADVLEWVADAITVIPSTAPPSPYVTAAATVKRPVTAVPLSVIVFGEPVLYVQDASAVRLGNA